MNDEARIGISPIPPTVGQEVVYTAGPNMEIVVEYEGVGSVLLTTDDTGQVTDVVPSGAEAVIVSDPNGSWQTNTSMIQQ